MKPLAPHPNTSYIPVTVQYGHLFGLPTMIKHIQLGHWLILFALACSASEIVLSLKDVVS